MTATLENYSASRINNVMDRIMDDIQKPRTTFGDDGIPARRIGNSVATCRRIDGTFIPEIIHHGGQHEAMTGVHFLSPFEAMETAAKEIQATMDAQAEMPERFEAI